MGYKPAVLYIAILDIPITYSRSLSCLGVRQRIIMMNYHFKIKIDDRVKGDRIYYRLFFKFQVFIKINYE